MNKSKTRIFAVLLLPAAVLSVLSCSSTRAIPEGEQLFTGLKKIEYTNYSKNEHAVKTQEEMEYVLASAPNGALFGSSYYRTPFPIRLWIWNAFSQSTSGIGRWIGNTFGSKPKLMSQVNPNLRASVAELQLRKYGYFRGDVDYKVVTGRNAKKAKIAYTVNMGPLWTVDSIEYLRFPLVADSLIRAHRGEAVIKNGDPFSVSALSNERLRLSKLFRNNGYYYYNEGYASYLADTVNVPGKVLLHFQMAESLDEILAEKLDGVKNCLEAKLFGIGLESYTVGSHDFVAGYCATRKLMYTLDTGHYEQTENVSDMVASLFLFVPELMLHVSRPVRWDSDHVTIMNDQTLDLFKELVRAEALDRAHIGLDYFDASINRIGAYVVGTRATQKCLLQAFLEPIGQLRSYEDADKGFERLALLEEAKSLPFGAVYDYFNLTSNVPVGEEFIPVIEQYEKDVLTKRG